MNRFLDRCEPLIEWLIRLSGWSAIFFVCCIFLFIFREGGPYLWNELEYTFADKVYEEQEGTPETLPTLQLTQLPYEVVTERLLEDIHEAAADGRITGLREVRQEVTDEVIIVLYLEPGTDLEQTFSQLQQVHPLRQDRSHVKTFFTNKQWKPESEKKRVFGIVTLFVGTMSVTLLAIVFAVPFSLGSAIYVSEFCSGKKREALKVLIELLAAIPSVVWGFIGYTILNTAIMKITGRGDGLNLFNGGLVLGLMSAPIMVSLAEDALKAVPESYREAALALGASRWQTVYKVLLPAAKNGILAAVLLGVGRAIGETMAVLMVTGHELTIPTSLFDSVRTMTATIAAELGEAVRGGGHYRSLFLIGIVLMFMSMVINLVADLVVKGIRGREDA